MSNYVPNYKNDIFISYAHVDNERLPGADAGWVTTLVSALKKSLAQKVTPCGWITNSVVINPLMQISMSN